MRLAMIGAITIPVAYLSLALWCGWDPFGQQWPLTIFAALVAGMILFKHRGNIARLRAGTESKIGSKSQSPV